MEDLICLLATVRTLKHVQFRKHNPLIVFLVCHVCDVTQVTSQFIIKAGVFDGEKYDYNSMEMSIFLIIFIINLNFPNVVFFSLDARKFSNKEPNVKNATAI